SQAVEPRRRLPRHPGLQPVRHAANVRHADRALHSGDRRQRAGRPARRPRHDPAEVAEEFMTRLAAPAFAAAVLATLAAPAALADDQLKLTIGQRGNWDTAITHLGTKAGIFTKHGIELEMIYTSGSGETLQPIIGGSADLGLAVGTLGAISAFAKGAPVRIIGAQATGAADYWYAKTSSPIKTLKDTTDRNTIAFSTNGSSTHSIVRAFINEFDIKAKPQPLLRPDRGHDRPGRHRLGIAPVRPEGDGGRQDPSCRQGDRCHAGARADHPHHRRQCRRAGKAQRRDRTLHEGVSRVDRL